MKDQNVTLTREQLFDLVWSKPISQLEKTHGFSEGSLAKLCGRRRVPTPPRGYWTQVHAEQTPARPRLPRSSDESPVELPPVHEGSDAPNEAANNRTDERIVVPERLQAPIAIVAHARDALRDAQEDENGMLKCPKGCMQITVSRKALMHALRVADALFKACEARGWPVRLEGERTVATVDTVSIAVTIVEGFDRSEAPIEPKADYYKFHYNRYSTYVYRPSGQLTVSIEATQRAYQPGVRRNWRGTEGKPVEAKLTSVLVGMNRLAMAVHADNEERARREQEAAERERAAERARVERERVQRAIAEEKSRVDYLLEQSRRWNASHGLRVFIEVARERGATGKLDLHGKDLQTWIAWAIDQANRLDPFVPNPAVRAGEISSEQGHS